MAKLAEFGFEPTPESTAYLNWSEDSSLPRPSLSEIAAAEDAWLEAQMKKQAASGSIKGALLRYQVADGYAWYKVSSLRPLTLQQVIGFTFEYAIPLAYVRGITKRDIEEQLDRERSFSKIFKNRTYHG